MIKKRNRSTTWFVKKMSHDVILYNGRQRRSVLYSKDFNSFWKMRDIAKIPIVVGHFMGLLGDITKYNIDTAHKWYGIRMVRCHNDVNWVIASGADCPTYAHFSSLDNAKKVLHILRNNDIKWGEVLGYVKNEK